MKIVTCICILINQTISFNIRFHFHLIKKLYCICGRIDRFLEHLSKSTCAQYTVYMRVPSALWNVTDHGSRAQYSKCQKQLVYAKYSIRCSCQAKCYEHTAISDLERNMLCLQLPLWKERGRDDDHRFSLFIFSCSYFILVKQCRIITMNNLTSLFLCTNKGKSYLTNLIGSCLNRNSCN